MSQWGVCVWGRGVWGVEGEVLSVGGEGGVEVCGVVWENV